MSLIQVCNSIDLFVAYLRDARSPSAITNQTESDDDNASAQSNDEQEDFDEPDRSTRKRKSGNGGVKRPRKKVAPRTASASPPPLAEVENYLYNSLMDLNGLHDDTALNWITEYEEGNTFTSLSLLADCLIRMGGSRLTVSPSIFEHEAPDEDADDEDSELLKEVKKIEKKMKDYPVVSYSLIDKSNHKSYRTALVDFITALIRYASEKEHLYAEDGDFLNPIINWSIAMSTSHYRSFRHVGALVSLVIADSLIDIRSERQKMLKKKESQATKGSKSVKSRAAAQVNKENMKIEVCSHYIMAIFDTVFSVRQKDVDSKIRLECLRFLGEWIKKIPEWFMGNNYLRYFGWALSDLATPVRLQVLHDILSIYRCSDFETSLRQFTEKYLFRFVEMAQYDSDNSVRKVAIDLLAVIQKIGFLNNDEAVKKIAELIYDTDARIRKSAANFIAFDMNPTVSDDNENLAAVQKQYSGVSNRWGIYHEVGKKLDSISRSDRDTAELYNALRFKPAISLISRASTALFNALELQYEDLVEFSNYLLFDFSSVAQRKGAIGRWMAQVRYSDNDVGSLLEVFDGFIRGYLHEAKERHKKHKSQTGSDPNVSACEFVMSVFKPLLAKYHFSTNLTSRVIRLLSVIFDESAVPEQKEGEDALLSVTREFNEQTAQEILVECGVIMAKAADSARYKFFVAENLLNSIEQIAFAFNQSLVENTQADYASLNVVLLKILLVPGESCDKLYNMLEPVSMKKALELAEQSNTPPETLLKLIELVKTYVAFLYKHHKTSGKVELVETILRFLCEIQVNRPETYLRLECILALTDCLIFIKMAQLQGDNDPVDAALFTQMANCESNILEFYKVTVTDFGKENGMEVVLDSDVQVNAVDDLVSVPKDGLIEKEFQLCTLCGKIGAAISMGAISSSNTDLLVKSARSVSSRANSVLKLSLYGKYK